MFLLVAEFCCPHLYTKYFSLAWLIDEVPNLSYNTHLTQNDPLNHSMGKSGHKHHTQHPIKYAHLSHFRMGIYLVLFL